MKIKMLENGKKKKEKRRRLGIINRRIDRNNFP